MVFSLLLSFLLLTSEILATDDVYNEELFIRQLSTGHVYSLFQFTNYLNVNIFDEKITPHYNLFPKSLGEIVSAFNIAELHLSLTQGVWRYSKWGYPVHSAPTGIALWIWFHPSLNKTSVDENWKGVVHALSGQFCSSLNFITKEFSANPMLSFKPLGVWSEGNANSDTHLRYATLSREAVCTENLTPWKKLLPCGDDAGFASLLDARRLFDSSYLSLAVHLRSVCEDNTCSQPQLELKQTVSHVFDGNREHHRNTWSLLKLFGRTLQSTCPVASISKLLIDVNDKSVKYFKLSHPAHAQVNITRGEDVQTLHMYDMTREDFTTLSELEVSVQFVQDTVEIAPYITLHKYVAGYGAEIGGIVCILTNTHPTESIRVTYLDVIPYYVRVYLHTLQIKVGDTPLKADKVHFTPGYYRDRPASIELVLTLPARTTTTVTIDFEKVFLDWMQYKPDAHHGFYLGSTIVSAYFTDSINSSSISEQCTLLSDSDSCEGKFDSRRHIFRRIFSEPLLIRVPLPDFSMPYNVLCLTCTVIAIGFGSIYNLTTKNFQVESNSGKKTLKEKLRSVGEKVVNSLHCIRNSFASPRTTVS